MGRISRGRSEVDSLAPVAHSLALMSTDPERRPVLVTDDVRLHVLKVDLVSAECSRRGAPLSQNPLVTLEFLQKKLVTALLQPMLDVAHRPDAPAAARGLEKAHSGLKGDLTLGSSKYVLRERCRLSAVLRAFLIAALFTASSAGATCYSDSECAGGKCRSGRCTTAGGQCYSDSECPGGKCRSGRCTTAGGRCYSDSECGGGKCRSGTCTTAGATCYSDSECAGGRCRSGTCTTAGATCYSDSECAGGKCRSGRCTNAGGQCYSDSECPEGTCRSGKCTNALRR
ncbi:MAG: hypothetical protein RL653_1529 [Pseudomonadota bacterium]